MQTETYLKDGEYFISSLDGEIRMGEGLTVGQYAVWRNALSSGQFQLIEVGTNLKALTEKYKISSDRIGKVCAV